MGKVFPRVQRFCQMYVAVPARVCAGHTIRRMATRVWFATARAVQRAHSMTRSPKACRAKAIFTDFSANSRTSPRKRTASSTRHSTRPLSRSAAVLLSCPPTVLPTTKVAALTVITKITKKDDVRKTNVTAHLLCLRGCCRDVQVIPWC